MKHLLKTVGTALFASLTFLLLYPMQSLSMPVGLAIAVGGAVLMAVYCSRAETGRSAWARGSLGSGGLMVAMPLLSMLVPQLSRWSGSESELLFRLFVGLNGWGLLFLIPGMLLIAVGLVLLVVKGGRRAADDVPAKERA